MLKTEGSTRSRPLWPSWSGSSQRRAEGEALCRGVPAPHPCCTSCVPRLVSLARAHMGTGRLPEASRRPSTNLFHALRSTEPGRHNCGARPPSLAEPVRAQGGQGCARCMLGVDRRSKQELRRYGQCARACAHRLAFMPASGEPVPVARPSPTCARTTPAATLATFLERHPKGAARSTCSTSSSVSRWCGCGARSGRGPPKVTIAGVVTAVRGTIVVP